MIPALKAEFRKLLTVKSTYILAGICLAFTILISFYVLGYLAGEGNGPADLRTLAISSPTAMQAIGLFVGLIGVLLVTHEYRYNTIMYTLTAVRRRWYVLAAKVIAVTVFVTLLALILSMLAPYLMLLGNNLKGAELGSQSLPSLGLLLRCVFYAWGTAMFGLIIAFIVRSEVGTIVTLLVFPSVIESLILRLILKENAKYLPFTVLDNVVSTGITALPGQFTQGQAMWLVLGYIVVGLGVATFLFQKRDAN